MDVLDLFSGIGGFSLGLERAGFRTVAFCESDPYCRRVLRNHWPLVPIFEDVRSLGRRNLDEHGIGSVGLVCGGYPCQPFSVAGKRRGAADDRHLWPEMYRIVQELRPAWVLGENVAGHVSLGLDQVLADLEAEGYAARAFVVPACAVDAAHRRERVWIVAHAGGQRLPGSGQLADPGHCAPEGQGQGVGPFDSGELRLWPTEPGVGRVADGVPGRVDRLRALGNAVVPAIPEIIGRAILLADTRAPRRFNPPSLSSTAITPPPQGPRSARRQIGKNARQQ